MDTNYTEPDKYKVEAIFVNLEGQDILIFIVLYSMQIQIIILTSRMEKQQNLLWWNENNGRPSLSIF